MWNLREDGFYSFTVQRKSYLHIQSIYIEITTCSFYVLQNHGIICVIRECLNHQKPHLKIRNYVLKFKTQ